MTTRRCGRPLRWSRVSSKPTGNGRSDVRRPVRRIRRGAIRQNRRLGSERSSAAKTRVPSSRTNMRWAPRGGSGSTWGRLRSTGIVELPANASRWTSTGAKRFQPRLFDPGQLPFHPLELGLLALGAFVALVGEVLLLHRLGLQVVHLPLRRRRVFLSDVVVAGQLP